MNKNRRNVLIGGGAAVIAWIASTELGDHMKKSFVASDTTSGNDFAVHHTDAEWHRLLSVNQYRVLRAEGTELPYSSPLNDEHRPGTFTCAGCALALYSSQTKFDSGTGWPSFWQPLDQAVVERKDGSFGMERTEIHCSRCGGHLGHVFNDGPQPTGLRYCMNGVAMQFTPQSA